MGRTLLFGAVMGAILLAAATTRSDVASSDNVAVDDTSSLPEPLTGTAVEPAAGGATEQKDPFAPFDVGPPESVWPYESLNPDEKAIVDRGRDVGGWQETHNQYGAAVNERSRLARAEAAQHLLGLDSELGDVGVVP